MIFIRINDKKNYWVNIETINGIVEVDLKETKSEVSTNYTRFHSDLTVLEILQRIKDAQ